MRYLSAPGVIYKSATKACMISSVRIPGWACCCLFQGQATIRWPDFSLIADEMSFWGDFTDKRLDWWLTLDGVATSSFISGDILEVSLGAPSGFGVCNTYFEKWFGRPACSLAEKYRLRV